MESPHATDIGPYRIVRPLGRGGMGIVYLAEHRQTAELVALKTVTSTTAGQLAGLRREIHALAQLSHPGVVRILDHGVASGTPWYAMELLEGMTLRQWMRSDARAETTSALDAASTQSTARTWTETIPTLDGTAPVEPIPSTLPPEAAAGEAPRRTLSTDYMRDVVTLAWRICGPLAYVHGAGIVHRDLKPDNIFLRTDGSPVLVDFGLVAGTGGGTSRERLEVGGETTGTAWYIAPEQVHGEIVDARADLYSLGCVLYELLTGRPPFTGDRPVQVLYKHVSTTPLPPSRLSDGIPGDLDALVMRLLGKAPADRPGYADGVATLLETLGATVADRAPATPYLYRPEMVGRDGAMGALSARLADLGRGRGSIALLRGESGAGKTRLAVQLGIVARREGHHVLSGECHDAPADAMLAPLQEPLVRIAAYCRDHGDAEHVLGGRRSSLAYVEPSILDLPAPPEPPLPRDLPPEALRRKLFADLTATLAALGSGPAGRTVLLLDDLQWADEATLAWLGTLVESIEGRPILVIGTHRAEEPRAELQKLADDPRVTTIPVERLGSADVGTMVREMLALESAADPIVEPLTAHSEGNPFYVAEYLRVAVAEGLLSRDALGHWRLASGAASISGLPLPRAIQDLVIRRIGLLSSAARSAANAAAILGRECATDVASAVSDLRGDDWLSALTELVARQVVEEVALGRIRFLHDKLREGTIAALDAAARRELHGRAAETLSAEGAGRAAEAAEVAAHWRDAGSHDAACGEFLRAARLALDAQLLALSERCYVEALALADVAMPEMVRARVELAERVLLALSRPEAARAEATTALHAARATGDRACEAHALRALGGAHRLQGARAEARDCLKRSLAIAESRRRALPLGHPRHAGVALHRGGGQRGCARRARSRAAARAGCREPPQRGDPEGHARAHPLQRGIAPGGLRALGERDRDRGRDRRPLDAGDQPRQPRELPCRAGRRARRPRPAGARAAAPRRDGQPPRRGDRAARHGDRRGGHGPHLRRARPSRSGAAAARGGGQHRRRARGARAACEPRCRGGSPRRRRACSRDAGRRVPRARRPAPGPSRAREPREGTRGPGAARRGDRRERRGDRDRAVDPSRPGSGDRADAACRPGGVGRRGRARDPAEARQRAPRGRVPSRDGGAGAARRPARRGPGAPRRGRATRGRRSRRRGARAPRHRARPRPRGAGPPRRRLGGGRHREGPGGAPLRGAVERDGPDARSPRGDRVVKAPRRIGPFAIESVLGRGGMGVVYRAVDDAGARVALKTVTVPRASLLGSIRREIHALYRLRHPAVVRILAEGLHEGLPWYAMELLSGATLRQLAGDRHARDPTRPETGAAPTVALGGALPAPPPGVQRAGWDLPALLRLVRRLCDPLAYIHGEGLVAPRPQAGERPDEEDRTPVLMDFGLAAHHAGAEGREADSTSRRKAWAPCGTWRPSRRAASASRRARRRRPRLHPLRDPGGTPALRRDVDAAGARAAPRGPCRSTIAPVAGQRAGPRS
ncbi:MAG: protein kinase [Acidobacteriota bacterium]